MDADGYSDDEMMDLSADPFDGELPDEYDDVEFIDDIEEDQEGDDLDDGDQEDKDVEKSSELWKPDLNPPNVGYCHICGAQVLLDELPDSISRDAFEQYGLCLNCQWGIYMDNGGHF